MMSIYEGKVPDRPAVRLWGLRPEQKLIHPGYEPVYRLAMEKSDLVFHAGSRFDLRWGKAGESIVETHEELGPSEEWVYVVTTVHTPEGELRSVYRRSTIGKPGYQMEYLLKEPNDIKKVLSVPYEPYEFGRESYDGAEAKVGERGITIFSIPHAMYGVQGMIGSENFALWSLEHRGLLLEAIEVFGRRIRDYVLRAVEAGVRGVFGWVGPELCIPPLMSPKDFDEFVFQFDKPLIDLIHDAGGHVWVHCHGRMKPVLRRFVEMGVDVLNPVEPPPMGDITLKEAFEVAGDRMGLEGNIETHDLMASMPERIARLVEGAIKVGCGRRFILCPSSSFMEMVDPTEGYIRNLITYIEEGIRWAEWCAKKCA